MAELWNKYESIPAKFEMGVNVRTRLIRALQDTEWEHGGEVVVQMQIGDQRGTDQFGLTTSSSRYIGGEVPAWIMKNCGKLVQHTPTVVERRPVAAS